MEQNKCRLAFSLTESSQTAGELKQRVNLKELVLGQVLLSSQEQRLAEYTSAFHFMTIFYSKWDLFLQTLILMPSLCSGYKSSSKYIMPTAYNCGFRVDKRCPEDVENSNEG